MDLHLFKHWLSHKPATLLHLRPLRLLLTGLHKCSFGDVISFIWFHFPLLWSPTVTKKSLFHMIILPILYSTVAESTRYRASSSTVHGIIVSWPITLTHSVSNAVQVCVSHTMSNNSLWPISSLLSCVVNTPNRRFAQLKTKNSEY